MIRSGEGTQIFLTYVPVGTVGPECGARVGVIVDQHDGMESRPLQAERLATRTGADLQACEPALTHLQLSAVDPLDGPCRIFDRLGTVPSTASDSVRLDTW